jgi:hypothetical protein
MQTAQVAWHPLGRQMMISDFNEPVIGNDQSQYSSDGRFQVYAGIMQESSKNSSAQEIVKLGAYNCLLGRGYGNSGAQPLALVILSSEPASCAVAMKSSVYGENVSSLKVTIPVDIIT